MKVLSEDERRASERFRFQKDRSQYIVAHGLLRYALSTKCSRIDATSWRFRRNRWGRPEIAEPRKGAQLRFSLSHTQGLAACAVAWDVAIGIDVEDTARPLPILEIAERVFSSEERMVLEALDMKHRGRRFFQLWTLKEAYAKARGIGLSLPLERASFEVTQQAEVRACLEAPLGDLDGPWHFELFCPGDRHVGAIALERPALAPRGRIVGCNCRTKTIPQAGTIGPRSVAK